MEDAIRKHNIILTNSCLVIMPTSTKPNKYVFRNGEIVKSDKAFDAWTSGDLESMEKALDESTNLLDRHYLLMNTVDQAYKNRSDPKMANLCAAVAEKHIAEFSEIRQVLLEDLNGVLPRVSTFQQYATLLTERGEYHEAIEVCEKAIEFGLRDKTKTGFEGRIVRIKKKLEKSESK